ncbi:MAG: SEL1-like repeat protein [Pseudomonadota bacterium]
MKRWLILVAAALSGCVPSQYMGISTSGPPSDQERRVLNLARQILPAGTGSCTDPYSERSLPCSIIPLNSLALASFSGNKHAQLELGRRFETGRGVERDLVKAAKLYKQASRTSGGPLHTCVWDEYQKRCNPLTIDLPYVYGLPEARRHLERIQARTEAAD